MARTNKESMNALGSLSTPIGHIKVGSMFSCKYRHPASKNRDSYIEIFDCIESGYYYVLGRYEHHEQIFTIEYIIHFTDFAKLLKKNIVEVL